MTWLINLAIKLGIYIVLLLILKNIFKDFKIKNNSVLIVGVILLVTDFVLTKVLGFISFPIRWLFLTLLDFIFYFIINVIIFKVVDAISEALAIKSFKTLLFSGLALSIAHILMRFIHIK